MSGRAQVALDPGYLMTKIAVSGGGASDRELLLRTDQLSSAPGSGHDLDALNAALAAARASRGEPDAGIAVTVAVRDAWLDGGVDGALRQEAIRHGAEDQLGLARVSWAGQLASVAALAASQHGFATSGHYLIGDIGGGGVRFALCEVNGRAVRPLAVHDAPGGGWADFDDAIRATIGAESDPGLAEWYLSAAGQDRRATTVLDRARAAPAFRDARVYELAGLAGGYELTAGQVADCFASTADRIQTGVAAILGAETPTVAVLTGGLAWFPLARQAVTEATGVTPAILGPEAAAAGALLLANGQAVLTRPSLPPVTMLGHRITDGLLVEESLSLPWTDSFTPLDDGPLVLAESTLTLDVGGRRMRLAVPDLPRGSYRVGVRPAWSGTGVVVLRASSAADPAPVPEPGTARDVFAVPLNLQEMSDE